MAIRSASNAFTRMARAFAAVAPLAGPSLLVVGATSAQAQGNQPPLTWPQEMRERAQQHLERDPWEGWLAALRTQEATDWAHADQFEDPAWAEQYRRVMRHLAQNETYLEAQRERLQAGYRHRHLRDQFRVYHDRAVEPQTRSFTMLMMMFLDDFAPGGWGFSDSDVETILAHREAYYTRGQAEILNTVSRRARVACLRRQEIGLEGLGAGGVVEEIRDNAQRSAESEQARVEYHERLLHALSPEGLELLQAWMDRERPITGRGGGSYVDWEAFATAYPVEAAEALFAGGCSPYSGEYAVRQTGVARWGLVPVEWTDPDWTYPATR